ncbi:hypothetical protein RUM44_009733 [Polyplax serrata]|uniref:RNA polymerase II subunit B1 CTD phosphatase RPAP2 homolog n=1 Tax=Polyplax serrata TaxID=468196 RepID=A0ABR1ATI9_POLSC
MLQQTLKKKKECNDRAQKIVEMLCEVGIEEKYLLDNLQFINQSHYDDITVERAILKICGYPLCDKQLVKVLPQQFHISTRYNKVFDITERKNFCSNSCYKSSMYLKNQLYTSPLWFRDQEVIPEYKLLKSYKSSLGREIVFFKENMDVPKDTIKEYKSEANKVKDIKEVNANEKCIRLSAENQNDRKPKECLGPEAKLSNETNKHENDAFGIHSKDDVMNCNDENIKPIAILENNVDDVKENINNHPKVNDTPEKKSCNTAQDTVPADLLSDKAPVKIKSAKDNVTTNIKATASELHISNVKCSELTSEKKNITYVGSVTKVETCIFEWFSVDSLFLLYGEKKLKELFSDKSVQLKEVLNAKIKMATNAEKIEKIIKLNGLLGTDTFCSDPVRSNLKPLPDYTALQEESKSIEIKVKAFYNGQLDARSTTNEKVSMKDKSDKSEECNDIYLPLIDSQAQNSLRRKILLDKLNIMLPKLVKLFSTNYVLQMSDVRKLVSTFSLTAHNITFKPAEWTLVGVILMKL